MNLDGKDVARDLWRITRALDDVWSELLVVGELMIAISALCINLSRIKSFNSSN